MIETAAKLLDKREKQEDNLINTLLKIEQLNNGSDGELFIQLDNIQMQNLAVKNTIINYIKSLSSTFQGSFTERLDIKRSFDTSNFINYDNFLDFDQLEEKEINSDMREKIYEAVVFSNQVADIERAVFNTLNNNRSR